MKRITALVASAAIIAGVMAVPASAGSTATAAATKNVSWGFSTGHSLSITRGTRVNWSWSSGGHNVVGPGFSSGGAKWSSSYARTFSSKGTFRVYCAPHSSIMKLTITVR